MVLTAQPAQAQFSFPRPSFGFPQRAQPQQQDICAMSAMAVQLPLACWNRSMRIGKLGQEPFHSQLQYAPAQFATGHDNYGISPAEWLELTDAELLARFLSPDRMNVVLQNFKAGDIKAIVLFYMAGQLANEPFLFGPRASPLLESFAIAYPACKGVDVLGPAGGACAQGFASLRNRFLAAGIGQMRMAGERADSWWLYGTVISRSDEAKAMPRARWLNSVARPYSEPSSMQDASSLVEAYLAGLRPAVDRVQQMANGCSGNNYVRANMANRGLSLQSVTDRAVQLGNAGAAMSFAQLARTGTCGAPADRKMSFRYMLKAAEMGHVPAMQAVAGLYANGDGVAENPREALAWARRAGDTDSTFVANLQKRVGTYDARIAREGTVTDVAGRAPNVATVRAVLLRETQWLYENSDFGLQSSLARMFGTQTEWDEATGTVQMGFTDTMGRDHSSLSMRSVQSFGVSGLSCSASGGGYSCRYSISVFMDSAIGALKLADNVQTRPVTVTDQFVFQNGRWRSPTMRARMLSGLRAAPARPSGDGGRSSLCRSLNAGVAAAGGRSTSAGLSPSTWGC